MQFAFYGRVSTEDHQDPASSRNWQLARSRQVIEPAAGVIVAEFFDIGQSRSLPWKRRPESLRLLEAFKNPERGFDAVVIGEPQRAFYGNQFGLTYPVFVHYGVGLWVPEVGGAVDPGSEAHDLVMSLYGGMSKGERSRIKTRVRTAMAAQAAVEGRFLGGRPPYGYTLGDAGPHPKLDKANDGRRLHRLVPDPDTAPVTQRIFAEFIGGAGLHRIAADLTRDGIPSPSAHDPERNRHRSSAGPWAKSAVRAILGNPRYTGHQVWNRQRRDEVLVDVEDVGLGHETKMRWNDRDAWVWSEQPAHDALVSTETFEEAQAIFGTRVASTAPRTPTEGRQYLLHGIMRCGLCGRRMTGQWNHGRAYYRCRFTNDYGVDPATHPSNVYVKEDAVVPGLDGWLAGLFDDEHVDHTSEILAGVAEADPEYEARQAELEAKIRDCDRRLAKYHKALDLTDEIEPFIEWIGDVKRERKQLETQLGRSIPGPKLTKEQVRVLITHLRGIVDVLADADPADKADLYAEMGVSLSYHPDGRVAVEALPRGRDVSVGGGT